MSLPEIFSLIFFMAFAVYFMFGIYILHFNIRSVLYRVFFLCTIALCIWAFSFCIANSAANYETCLFWRRIAAIGWGTVFSLFLHFVIIVTEHNQWFRHKWIYIVLYLPAAINIAVFTLIGDIAIEQYNLINTSMGWVNISHNTVWDWFYNVQYLGFSTISLILLMQWGVKSKSRDNKKQSTMLSISFVVSIFLGTLTEFVINIVSDHKIPQVAPLIILILISAMFYCIRKYGLLSLPDKDKDPGMGKILSEATRSKLYLYITRAFFFGAFIHFCAPFYTGRETLLSIILFSAVLLFFGFLLQFIQILNISEGRRDFLSDIVMTVSVPIIVLKYIDYSVAYAWIAPVIYIIVSVALNNRRTLYLISFVSIITFILIWIRSPESSFAFRPVDHAVRISMLIIIVWIARFIHDIYLHRLAENEEQVKLQMLVSHVSSVFVTVNEGNVDEKINTMLGMCVEQFELDCACLLFLTGDQKTINKVYQWNLSESSGSDFIDPKTGKPSWQDVRNLIGYGSLYIQDVDLLQDNDPVKEWLKSKRVKSMVVNPLMINNKMQGFMAFMSSTKAVSLRKDQQDILIILANIISDIWFRVEMEKEINHKAFYDSLTGLPNRELFMTRLQQEINLAQRNGKLVAVAFVDIDSFKTVNDTMGHEGGDLLLVHMAHRLSSNLRKFDTISRFGGDEFLIMISQVSQLKEILSEADKIMESIKKPIQIKNQEFFVTASMGIAVFPIDGEMPDDLIKNSDLAMYASKQRGKNKYTLCSYDMKKDLLINMELTNDLYRALERNEFLLYYQPQVNNLTGKIAGVEALIRWQHPRKGMVPPSKFILVAEKTGLISPIGQWVLLTACRQNKAWQDMGLPPVKMAVNLSIAQFMNPSLVGMVKDALMETGLDPKYLELEVTESIAGNEVEYTIKKLVELKELGVSITMDDFGTEYSSLSRIKVLPVDRIKIDGQFIHGIGKSSKDEGIIKVIIQLGKSLELEVLAEKVETEEQLLFLKENLCDHIQGFYFYKPMPADEAETILRSINM